MSKDIYTFFFILLLVKFSFQLVTGDPANSTIILVQILFRHGDRTPVETYPKDKYNESFWSNYGGFGQLTQTGMKQHYEYGLYLRNRYSDFLSKIYNRNNVYAISTNYDRTLMSAYSLLSGLYEPNDFQIWNKEIKWQPIPVHTTDSKTDTVFYSNPCPRYLELKSEVINSDEYTQANNNYKDLFDVINGHSGFTNMSLDSLWTIGDALFVEKTHGLTLPSWAESSYNRIVGSLGLGFYFDYRLSEMAQLTSGGILREMRKNIMNKVNFKTSNEIYLFSGHDTYVAALTKLLNLTEYIDQPPYVSSVIMELRKYTGQSDKYFVQVYLKNNTANETIKFIPLNIYGCDLECPLEKFLNLTESLQVNDFDVSCKSQKKAGKILIDLILLYATSGLIIGLSVSFIFFATFSILKNFGYIGNSSLYQLINSSTDA